MKKTINTIILSLIFAFYYPSFGADPTSEQVEKKNVLFIVVDDLNNTIGTYGHPTVLTPNIDKLASQGIQFNKAYCNYAVCNPSRSSFLMGLLPETLGITDNITPLQTKIGERLSLPALFKRNGYYTASLGKVFHGNAEHNDPNAWYDIFGFSATELGKKGEERNLTDGDLKWCRWQAAEGTDIDQPDGQIAEKAIDIIKANKGEPFFLAVGFHKPHDPFIAPKKYFDMYPLVVCDPPILPEGWTAPYKYSLPSEIDIFARFTDQDRREFLRSYYACTSFMDAQVGKVIDAVKEVGILENTLIVFLGDHGYHLGEHDWWNKVTIYEKGHNTPLIFLDGAKIISGVETNAMIEFIDLYPTIADLCNLEDIPDYLEGISFKSVIENPMTSHRDMVYAIISRGSRFGKQKGTMFGKTIKTRDWRYIEWDDGNQGIELYDEHADPLEYNNLAANKKFSDVITYMKELLAQYD